MKVTLTDDGKFYYIERSNGAGLFQRTGMTSATESQLTAVEESLLEFCQLCARLEALVGEYEQQGLQSAIGSEKLAVNGAYMLIAQKIREIIDGQ